MSAQDNIVNKFEHRKAEVIAFFDQAKDCIHRLEKIGAPFERLRNKIDCARDELLQGEFRIGVIGRFRIGKSTFLNVFLGDRILKEREAGGGCTAVVTKVRSGRETGARVHYNSPEEMYESFIASCREAEIVPDVYRVVVDDIPLSERLDFPEFRENNKNILKTEKEKIKEGFTGKKALIDFALFILEHWEKCKGQLGRVEEVSQRRYLEISTDRSIAPFIREIQLTVDFGGVLPDNVVLMDTPGLGAPNWDEAITARHLKDCHAAIHMLLPPAGFESIDLNLLTKLKEEQPHIIDKMVFVLNRSDDVSTGARKEIQKHVEEEIASLGFSHMPVLFCCSKLPFLMQLKKKGVELSTDEAEYLDFTSYRFKLDSSKDAEVMNFCGFTELQKTVNELFKSGQAESALQQSVDMVNLACDEVDAFFSTRRAMVESGKSGESKFIEVVNELLTTIEYEKDRLDREIFQATSSLRGKVFAWLSTYRNVSAKESSWWTNLVKYMGNTSLYDGRKHKKEVQRDLNIKFLGYPITISGFKEKLDAAAEDIAEYVEEFWSWDNYNKCCDEAMAAENIKTADAKFKERIMTDMRSAFLPVLSAKIEEKVVPVLDGVTTDMSNLHGAALSKTKEEMTGISEILIRKLNKILKTSFRPVEVGQFSHSVEGLEKAKTHFHYLGRENGIWEKTMTMTHTMFVNAYSDKVKKKESMRFGRIRQDIIEHLERQLFVPMTKQIVSYITRVVKDLKDVMMLEVEMQLEDIKSYALVDKFGSSEEQIKKNIENALGQKAEIDKIEASYKESLLPLRSSINESSLKSFKKSG